jgi:glyoxalase family protein
VGQEGKWQRYGLGDGGSGQYVDLQALPETRRGAWGTGSVHHIAWRVADEAHQLEVREAALRGGAHPTPVIDRFWFKSVYFREPGGVLFELATDGPGFHVDEAMATLGETLVLPPWLEAERGAIEAVLPQLTRPSLA